MAIDAPTAKNHPPRALNANLTWKHQHLLIPGRQSPNAVVLGTVLLSVPHPVPKKNSDKFFWYFILIIYLCLKCYNKGVPLHVAEIHTL